MAHPTPIHSSKFRANLSTILDRVQGGERFVITHYDKRVAFLMALDAWSGAEQAPPTPEVHVPNDVRRIVEKIAAAVVTMDRDTVTAEEQGLAVAKECRPLFEALGMSDRDGDGWGFPDDEPEEDALHRADMLLCAFEKLDTLMVLNRPKNRPERLRREAERDAAREAVIQAMARGLSIAPQDGETGR